MGLGVGAQTPSQRAFGAGEGLNHMLVGVVVWKVGFIQTMDLTKQRKTDVKLTNTMNNVEIWTET